MKAITGIVRLYTRLQSSRNVAMKPGDYQTQIGSA